MVQIIKKNKNFLKKFFKKIVVILYNFFNFFQIILINFKNYFFSSIWFHVVFIEIVVFLVLFLMNVLQGLNVVISDDSLSNIASTIGAVIGGAVAILFTLSTFILQSNADLFSTRYLKKIISNAYEKITFWLLVILSVISFVISFSIKSNLSNDVTNYHLFGFLIGIVFISFYLIFIFYEDLREKVNPETYLIIIRNNAIKQLNKIHRRFRLAAKVQDIVIEYENKDKVFLTDVQYKSYPAWATIVLENIKHLYEMSLRLIAKNEIEATKLASTCIGDVYLEYLKLRNGNLSKTSASMFMLSSTVDDQGFTPSFLEYLQSLSNKFLQENRKENSTHILNVYEKLLGKSLYVKFSSGNQYKDNPMSSLIFEYYGVFIESIIKTKDLDLIWAAIKSLNNMQSLILQKTDDDFLLRIIDEKLEKISLYFVEKKDSNNVFIKEVANICFNRIKLSWDKYHRNEIFWDFLFANLKKHLMMMSIVSTRYDFSIGELFMNFNQWQTNVVNFVLEIKDDKQQKNMLDKYVTLLENWSDFLLDVSRDLGIANNPLGLPIIQCIEQNLNIVDDIKNKTTEDLVDIYRTQFNTLSWFFHNVKQIKSYYSDELNTTFEILTYEIIKNLKNAIRIEYTENIINQYIALIHNLCEKIEDSYGYSQPRIIVKLVPLGVILDKYKHKDIQKILGKVIELNNKYVEKYKEFWKIKEEKNISGPSNDQICKEINELKEEIFSLNGMKRGMNYLLYREITSEDWDMFVEKIGYCSGKIKKYE